MESETRSQFAIVYVPKDYRTFKIVADNYLATSSTLRNSDIKADNGRRLLLRNSQKRLFIGVGTELLLKAAFLKSGFYINVPKKPKEMKNKPPYEYESVQPHYFSPSKTHTMHFLIENLACLKVLGDQPIDRGLRIAKIFRNKEAHVVAKSHTYVSEDYRSIEYSIVSLYKDIFQQHLELRFSFGVNESGVFSSSSTSSIGST